ncbi:hypothetical protein JJB98_01120 [Bradyrhizobium diazoefficiens]|nr:hypothetical protein [Bradyrhizobium diazoefficiens]QQO18614.1 hypothetical protein JJB98_01120 [Bradyrhizobium diazoefficiens]
MELAHFFRACGIIAICTAITCSSSRAEVTVYKEACGHDAFEDWNLTCKIDNNTFAADPSDFRTTAFRDIRSITICTSFNNGGGLNVPAIFVHNYNDGRQSKPTELFDSVKFQGGLTARRVSWVGTSPRLVPAWPAAWSMRANLTQTDRQNSFTYTETLLNGQRPVAEIRGSCSFLEDGK